MNYEGYIFITSYCKLPVFAIVTRTKCIISNVQSNHAVAASM